MNIDQVGADSSVHFELHQERLLVPIIFNLESLINNDEPNIELD
jgi:hypothetical protein